MVYPTLQINQDDYEIQLHDTNFDDNPFFRLEGCDKEESALAFSTLLSAFMNQYDSGYDQGWTDAESMLEEEQDYDC